MFKSFKYEGDLEPLITWAVNKSNGEELETPPEPYNSWVIDHLPDGCGPLVKYWVGVITRDSHLDGDWVKGYPHTHVRSVKWPPETITLMLYLVIPEEGGELGVGGLNKEDPYQFITTEPGLTVMVDAATWHGVKPVHKGTRIALIGTAVPAGWVR